MKAVNSDRLPVFLRLQPCPPGSERIIEILDEKTVKVLGKPENQVRRDTFNAVFPEEANQEDVFRQCALPLIESLLQQQKNALLMTYGASGSGKTHTVSGCGKSKGLLSMTIDFLFHHLDCNEELTSYTPRNFDEYSDHTKLSQDRPAPKGNSRGIFISIIQIYNEVLTDLLDETQLKPLSISQDSRGRCFVRDARWVTVASQEQASQIIQTARNRQNVAFTKLNESSSRSHFAVFIKIIHKIENDTRVSQMVIVDLAGTERQAATGTSGTVLRQAGFINSSLLVLRRCIDGLRKNSQAIPFRDSKLTRVLSPFFTTMTRINLVVCVSTCKERLGDTLTSLKFAANASELLHSQDTVKRFRETRRKSGECQNPKTPSAKTDVVDIPLQLYNEMREDLQTAEKLAVEHAELQRRLQTAEETAENMKLMYLDQLAALRKENRLAVRAVREEHEALRSSIEEGLLEELRALTEKNAKYKHQSRKLANFVRERLYPELKFFREKYGIAAEFPPLVREDIELFAPPIETPDDCARCKTFQQSLDGAVKEVRVRTQENVKLAGQLRCERELRVFLQEKVRESTMRNYSSFRSSMELTCQEQIQMLPAEITDFKDPSTMNGDSGNETKEMSSMSSIESDSKVSQQTNEEICRLHETVVHLTSQLDQKEMVIQASEARIVDLEEKYAEVQAELTSTKDLLLKSKSDDGDRVQTQETYSCNLNCDRCLKRLRLQELPQTTPTLKNGETNTVIRESHLAFTPVFCGKGMKVPRTKKILPRRRLQASTSSDPD